MSWNPYKAPQNTQPGVSQHSLHRLLHLLCYGATAAAAACLVLAAAGGMADWMHYRSPMTAESTDLFRCGAFLLLLRGVLVSVFLHHPALMTDE